MTVGNIITAKFISGDSIIPVSNDLNKNIVPSWVKEIILVNILPTNSKAEEIRKNIKYMVEESKESCLICVK